MAKYAVEVLIKSAGGPQAKAAMEGVGAGARGAAPMVEKLAKEILGFEISLKGLGSLAAQAFAGFGALAIGTGIIRSIGDAQKAFAQLEAGVRSTGGAAGFSADQLAAYASQLQKLTAVDDEAIEGAQAVLLTFTKIGREVFPAATRAVLDLSARLGTDLNSAALQIGKALNDPVKGVTALTRAGVQFSAAQKEMIASLVDSGRLLEAQGVILRELETQVGGSAEAFRSTLPGALAAVKNALSDVFEVLGGAGASRIVSLLNAVARGFEFIGEHGNALIGVLTGLAVAFAALRLASWGSEAKLAATAFNILMTVVASTMAPVTALTYGMTALNAAIAANPAGAVAIALAALTAATVSWAGANRDAKKTADDLSAALDRTNERLKDQAVNMATAAEATLKAAIADREKLQALIGNERQLLRTFVPERIISNPSLAPKGSEMEAMLQRFYATTKAALDNEGAIIDLQKAIRGEADATKKAAEEDVFWNALGRQITETLKKRSSATKGAATEAARLEKRAEKARGATEEYLAGLAVDAGQAARLLNIVTQGQKAYKEEVLKQKVADEIFKQENKLREVGLKLTVAQREEIDKNIRRIEAANEATVTWVKAFDGLKSMPPLEIKLDTKRIKGNLDTFVVEMISTMQVEFDGEKTIDEWNTFGKSIHDGLKSASENAQIYMAEVADAVKRGALSAEDAERELAQVRAGLLMQALSDWQNFFDTIAGLFGGATGKIASQISNMISRIQQAYQAGQSISSGLGNMGMAGGAASAIGGAAGGVLIMAAVLRGIYEIRKGQKEAQMLRQYAPVAVTGTTPQGQWLDWTTFEGEGREASEALRRTAEAFAQAIGGVIDSFAYLEIRVRRDGKYFQAVVQGEVIGTFQSMEAAQNAAFLEAMRSFQTKMSGMSELVRQGFEAFRADEINFPTLEGLQGWLEQLREIAEIPWGDGTRQIIEQVRHFDELWEALSRLRQVTPQVTEGYNNLIGAEADAWRRLIRSYTGQKESPQEMQARMQREAEIAKAQLMLRIAELKYKQVELKEEARIIQARAQFGRTELEIGGREITGRGQILKAKGELYKAEMTLEQARLEAINAELEAIAALLIELEKLAAEFDPKKIKIPRLGAGGADSRQAALDRLGDLRAAAGGTVSQTLMQYTRDLAEWNRVAKEGKLTAAQRAEGERLLRQEMQKTLREQMNSLAGRGGGLEDRYREAQKFFDDLQKAGRKETGIPDWEVRLRRQQAILQLGGEAMAALGDQTALARQQLGPLAEAMNFLRNHADELGLSTQRLGEIAQQTSSQLVLSIAGSLDQYIEDEDVKRQLAEIRFRMDLANAQVQIEMAFSLGLLLQADYDFLKGLLNLAGNFDPGKLVSGGSGGGGRDFSAQENLVKAQEDAAKAWLELVRTIDKSNKDLLTDRNLSALSPQGRLAAAVRIYEETFAKAKAGDVQALRDYTGVRQTALELMRAAENSGPKYAEFFDKVFKEGASLVLSADTERNAVANLIKEQTESAQQGTASIVQELMGVRSSVVEGLNNLARVMGQPPIVNGIPKFAAGGIATRPSLAGEGRYPEAIVPLPNSRAIPVQFTGGGAANDDTASAVTRSGIATHSVLTLILHEQEEMRKENRDLKAKIEKLAGKAARSQTIEDSKKRQQGRKAS